MAAAHQSNLAEIAAGNAEVTSIDQTPKAALPVELFRRDQAPVLVLITCGGTFDRTTRHYADNVVVTARPL
jgi:hypothetical protein